MSTHIQKVKLETKDMFIYSIDTENQLIEYELRDSNGNIIDSLEKDSYRFENGKCHFGGRWIDENYFGYLISQREE